MRKFALALATTAVLGMAALAFAIEFWDCGADPHSCRAGKRQRREGEDQRQLDEYGSSSSWHE